MKSSVQSTPPPFDSHAAQSEQHLDLLKQTVAHLAIDPETPAQAAANAHLGAQGASKGTDSALKTNVGAFEATYA